MTINNYFLMHKDIEVARLSISNDGNISNLQRNREQEDHFPVGGMMNDMKFFEWWNDRAIPRTRHGAKAALQALGYVSTNSALVNNLALSLNDCYWIKPIGSKLNWKNVNLFKNDFIDTFGELTFNENSELRNKTKFSFATSQGELKKKWCINKAGERFLVKGNYGDSYQQSINEVFASQIYKQIGFDNYLEYNLCDLKTETNGQGIGCYSFNFCNEEIESIPVWEYLQTRKIKKNNSLYWPLKEICLDLGMDEEYFDNFMDHQIMIDFLLTNTDRHMNNIALLRNPDSLKILGFAPIYDNGNSMFYNIPFEKLNTINVNEIETHSFIKYEIKLLQYVKDRNRIDLTKIKPDFSVYDNEVYERRMRKDQIIRLFNIKLELLKKFQNGNDIWSYKFKSLL